MDAPKVKALISLLDDPDVSIYHQVKDELIKIGPLAIHPLEEAWENAHNPEYQKRIENIIHQIQFENVKSRLLEWAQNPENDLLEGALNVARFRYANLDAEKIKKKLEQIRRDIWLELNDNLTALEKIRVVNHIFYDVYGFSGNVNDYHAPDNSYLNVVLESKKGNPLSLSTIYMILTQQLGMPVYGVNLPEHFVLCYLDTFHLAHSEDEKKKLPVLFYINAFTKGVVFARRDIDNFLKQLNLQPQKNFYEPCSNLDIIKRMLRNLILSYEKKQQNRFKNELTSLLEMLENKPHS